MIAIIDGDVLCYLACNTERWKTKVKIENNTTFIELDESGKRKSLEFTKDEDRKHLETSWQNFNRILGELLEETFCIEYKMAVKGEGNFRNDLFPEYKLNRHKDPTKQNIFVPVLRKLAVAEDMAVEAHGMEADDLMRIWAEEARALGTEYIICSIDKDLRCIPGKHWSMKKRELLTVSEEQALRNYYHQLLKGDPTDNILGIPGIGEVKATRILAPYSNEDDFQEQVVEQYLSVYGDDWEKELIFTGKMIYLKKAFNDEFSLDSWPVVQSLKGDLALKVENEI